MLNVVPASGSVATTVPTTVPTIEFSSIVKPCKAVITGVSSSSVMVAVWLVVTPRVALVGVPISTMTVSSFSSRSSTTMAMVIVPVVLPAVIIIGLGVIL